MEVVPTAAVPHIAPDEFWAAHLGRPDARPLLIESCPTLGAAPALRWTLESLRGRIGARSVDVRCMSAGAGEYRDDAAYHARVGADIARLQALYSMNCALPATSLDLLHKD